MLHYDFVQLGNYHAKQLTCHGWVYGSLQAISLASSLEYYFEKEWKRPAAFHFIILRSTQHNNFHG